MARKYPSHPKCEFCANRELKRQLKRAKAQIREAQVQVSDEEAMKFIEAREKLQTG